MITMVTTVIMDTYPMKYLIPKQLKLPEMNIDKNMSFK